MKKIENLLAQKTKKELISIILNERNKKYGLVWDKEYEREKVVLKCLENFPVFFEQGKYRINHKNYSYLIEGDNYHSLLALSYTHKGLIDVIYIDPPYNTGNKDFEYNDRFVGLEDGYRHSKWLNFMQKRLLLARNLLREDGLIFISIDDNEIFQLKLLCDQIFGESNYVNTISVNTKNNAGASGGGEDRRLKKNVEYVLVYSRNYDILKLNNVYDYKELYPLLDIYKEERISWKYNSVLVNPGKKVYIDSTVDGDGNEIKIYKRIGTISKSIKQFALENKMSEEEVYNKHYDKIYRTTMPQSSIRPRVIDKMSEINRYEPIISIEYVPKTGKNKGMLYEQFYSGKKYNLFAWLKDVCVEKDGIVYKKEMQGTLWDLVSETKNLSKEGNIKFDNGKKPIKLIKQLISLHPNKDALVLDFFAGSASTGHAVWSLNKDDDGNRKFILCQKREKKNIAFDIAYKRLKNCIDDDGLIYLKNDFIKLRSDKEDMKMKAVSMLNTSIKLKENAFNTIKENKFYTIVSSDTKNIVIYNWYFEDKVNDLNVDINKLKLKVDKIYYYDNINVYETLLDVIGSENIEYAEIPSEIMNEYFKIRETII